MSQPAQEAVKLESESAPASPVDVGTIVAGELQLKVWAHAADGRRLFHTVTIHPALTGGDVVHPLHLRVVDLPKVILLLEEAYRGACLSGGFVDWAGEAARPPRTRATRGTRLRRRVEAHITAALEIAAHQVEAEQAAIAAGPAGAPRG